MSLSLLTVEPAVLLHLLRGADRPRVHHAGHVDDGAGLRGDLGNLYGG